MKKFLKKLLDYWKLFAKRLGVIQTFIILSIIYWILFGLVAVIAKFFARDLLKKKIGKERSFWFNKQYPLPTTSENLRRQF